MKAGMERLRALIVDDEPLARERVRTLLSREPDVDVIGECGDGEAAQKAILELAPDVVFLDIQMPGLDGVEVLSTLPSEKVPVVVFVTAHDRFALKAFDLAAVDYLLKPFDPDRFSAAVERARQRIRTERREELGHEILAAVRALGAGQTHPERLTVKDGGRITFVRVPEISHVESAGNYVCLTAGGETHTLRETLQSLEARLDPMKFVRIHRSTLVNVEHIRELHPLFGGDSEIQLTSGKRLTVSRTNRDRLQAVLGKP